MSLSLYTILVLPVTLSLLDVDGMGWELANAKPSQRLVISRF